ncbi:MAG: RnfH family protein [Thiotrichales bacterium]|nr:MAG: RnfH family protein [Thiotrichales bacterium]
MGTVNVAVVYALEHKQLLVSLRCPQPTTVKQAILMSGILKQIPSLSIDNLQIGIFSKAVAPDTNVQDGDRIEIYRELIADPKAARFKRVRAKPRNT